MFARQPSLPFPSTRSSQAIEPRQPAAGRPSAGAFQAKVVRLQTGSNASHESRAIPLAAAVCVVPPVACVAPKGAEAAPAGQRFAAMRRQHAVEMFGACMMIATFLVLALFA